MNGDTKRAERRTLRFHSIDDLEAEIDRIVAAERAGRLRSTGNWTTGQIFGHLAAWINYGWEGYPFKVPALVRWIIRLQTRRLIERGLPAGARLPRVDAGTYGVEVYSTEEGARRLKDAIRRLRREPATHVSPAFGRIPEDQRIALNLRHAELHLGFLHYDAQGATRDDSVASERTAGARGPEA